MPLKNKTKQNNNSIKKQNVPLKRDGQITLGPQKQAVVLLNSCLNSERSVMNHSNLSFSAKN